MHKWFNFFFIQLKVKIWLTIEIHFYLTESKNLVHDWNFNTTSWMLNNFKLRITQCHEIHLAYFQGIFYENQLEVGTDI